MFLLTCDKKLTKSQLSPTNASTKRKITDELKHNAGWYEVREGSPVYRKRPKGRVPKTYLWCTEIAPQNLAFAVYRIGPWVYRIEYVSKWYIPVPVYRNELWIVLVWCEYINIISCSLFLRCCVFVQEIVLKLLRYQTIVCSYTAYHL